MDNYELVKLRFEASENRLKQELESNPTSCIKCSCWRAGGDMSRRLYHCDSCGSKQAFSNIHSLIVNFAQKRGISYEESWDIANELLKSKSNECAKMGTIYFDEDHFYGDLSKHYTELLGVTTNTSRGKKPSLVQKILNLIH